MVEAIREFRGEYRWLSNFWPAKVVYGQLPYPSVEHAYQAAKCADIRDRVKFLYGTAGEAKRLGRRVKMRADWVDYKLGVMEGLLRQKFAAGTELASWLEATGSAELVEGNYWHDNFWGVCTCLGCTRTAANRQLEGLNHLGKLLMEIRHELRTGEEG